MSEYELLTCSEDETVKVIDTTLFRPIFDIYFKHQAVSTIEYDFKGNLIYTGHSQGSIKSFDYRLKNKIAS